VGPYYPEGFKPVTLYANNKYVRAWPGGTGDTKLAGNYAPTILPQAEAAKKGYTQVLWLYGEEEQVTEVGTMNIFFLIKNKDGEKELITPTLDGTILPGVTRDSVLNLARSYKEFKVTEKVFYMDEIVEALNEKRVLECFGCGTAAIVTPVKKIHYNGVDYNVPINEAINAGELTRKVWQNIVDIQYGRKPSPWSVIVE
jgi:branched-chain amino acid aminotransferase